MYNFFKDNNCRQGDSFLIDGSDFNHIVNVLRMKIGDDLLVSCQGESHLCTIEKIYTDHISVKISSENFQSTELPVKIILYQGLPKADKMELIIQKAVELGIHKIIPVEMNRSVVKLDQKKKSNKVLRWQAIAESAAKQSKRNSIPVIGNIIDFDNALLNIEEADLILVPYENKSGMKATVDSLKKIKNGITIAIVIGPEGGFENSEIEKLRQKECDIISLGKRILRTETAAITSLSMLMLYCEMNSEDE